MASKETDQINNKEVIRAEADPVPVPVPVRTPKRPISHLTTETPGIRFPQKYRAARHVKFKTPISETLGTFTASKIAGLDGECDEPRKQLVVGSSMVGIAHVHASGASFPSRDDVPR